MKTAEEFIKEIAGSEALKKELEAIKDKDMATAFLKKNDVDGTAEEFAKALNVNKIEGEISDDAAEAVAGGWDLDYMRYAGWEVTPKYGCPKCGAGLSEVENYDPGWCWRMRVHCRRCGYVGERG